MFVFIQKRLKKTVFTPRGAHLFEICVQNSRAKFKLKTCATLLYQVLFTLPKEDVSDSQLISLDAVDPDVGQAAQKQMAELLTHRQVRI
jgi:hypothetical protein